MFRRLIAPAVLVGLTSCTPGQISVWLGWYAADPEAAVEFANEPWVQESLDNRSHGGQLDFDGQAPSLSVGGQRGNCSSYAPAMEAAGLPVDTFLRIAWRESGCDHTVRVDDHNDTGGGLFGFNFQGDGGYWAKCGLTLGNLTSSIERQMDCAAMAYDELGLNPWG